MRKAPYYKSIANNIKQQVISENIFQKVIEMQLANIEDYINGRSNTGYCYGHYQIPVESIKYIPNHEILVEYLSDRLFEMGFIISYKGYSTDNKFLLLDINWDVTGEEG